MEKRKQALSVIERVANEYRTVINCSKSFAKKALEYQEFQKEINTDPSSAMRNGYHVNGTKLKQEAEAIFLTKNSQNILDQISQAFDSQAQTHGMGINFKPLIDLQEDETQNKAYTELVK
jgi:hypothetical protein